MCMYRMMPNFQSQFLRIDILQEFSEVVFVNQKMTDFLPDFKGTNHVRMVQH